MNHSMDLIYQVPGYNRTRKKQRQKDMSDKICGFICNAGTDFIELVNEQNTKIMIMKDKIRHIDFNDCDCRPFHEARDCDCDDGESDDFNDCHCGCDQCNCECNEAHHSCYHSGIPVCDDRIQLRLAGFGDSLNFKFFMLKGCKVCIDFNEN